MTTTLVSVLYGCSVVLAKEATVEARIALNVAVKAHRNATPADQASAKAEDKKLILAQRKFDAAIQAEIRALNEYYAATSLAVNLRAVRA